MAFLGAEPAAVHEKTTIGNGAALFDVFESLGILEIPHPSTTGKLFGNLGILGSIDCSKRARGNEIVHIPPPTPWFLTGLLFNRSSKLRWFGGRSTEAFLFR
jgi:hypothetical protein